MSTKISWTNETWNPVHGCSHAGSPGCDHCYARRMSKRLAGRYGYPPAPDNFKVTLRPDRLEQPLKWRKPRRIFVCSMSDLFHDDVPFMFIGQVMSVAALAMQRHGHVFQFLTKRPARMLEFCHSGYLTARGWSKLPFWLGVTVENQQTADERIPLLLQTPAVVRFVSAEPLLSAVDLSKQPKLPVGYRGQMLIDYSYLAYLDWVIVGGETGPGARPMHPNWARGLKCQCQAADIPYFHKSNGAWLPGTHPHNGSVRNHGYFCADGKWINRSEQRSTSIYMCRVGSKRAGHLLDGKAWRQMPRHEGEREQ